MIRRSRAKSDPAVEAVCKLKSHLDIPEPWNLDQFLDHVAATVGKPIRLVPEPDLAARGFPCGIVVERVDDIVIAYDSAGSRYHGDHIVLHEIGHLLLNHHAAEAVPGAGALGDLLPDLNPQDVLRVLGRTDYDDAQENQAELFASLVMAESVRARPRTSLRATFFPD